ncbi:hypothetical protein BG846_03692 [Streptomyces fradiae ATCC 10745 = DSM 40063]|uniref:Uncharacterized protein n=1 Tax=Streptomyces fradiae ATCC 10745 = DSM 40063 TaxID=1319510 RepID=A0A1Y2NUS8_STRFR|nr:hypothetical protein BG846_03692 [Streptomyces fradiae ATCC 10745 = DSM 40063]
MPVYWEPCPVNMKATGAELRPPLRATAEVPEAMSRSATASSPASRPETTAPNLPSARPVLAVKAKSPTRSSSTAARASA